MSKTWKVNVMNLQQYPISIIAIMMSCTVIGNLLLKIGADQEWKFLGFFSWVSLLGMCSFGVGAIIYAWLLQKIPLNVAQVFLSLQYIAVILASYFLLSEPISLNRWLGMSVIFIGFLIASRA